MENEGEKRYNKHLEKRAAAVDRKAASAAEKGSRSGLRCESGRLGCAEGVSSMKRRLALPEKIEIRGARVHNLKNIDVDIRRFVRGGFEAVSRIALDLHEATDDTGRQGTGG